ncbi:preATP grasp domain-containing protein [Amycolatopsis aidingensis]|uniref:preATP grasp domain-containing protein n=1 Tax=Amycolatopsis aidingensis TaxID=2842453 RepID=UPI001C0B2AE6|nr:peptide ligase PGM1-related protein [Amycolatopsis aidingensis]
MVSRLEDIPEDVRPTYDTVASRLLWTLDNRDVAVVPGPADAEFVDYVRRVLGLTGSGPTVLSLQDFDRASWYPGDNPELIVDLKRRIGAEQPWSVRCYLHDRDVAHWQRLLGLESEWTPYAQNMAELVNTKSVFRTLAEAEGIPVPEGRVVDPGAELVDTVTDLLSRTGSIILKEDRNSGGDGNTLVTTDHDVRHIGAYHAVQLPASDCANVAAALDEIGLASPPAAPRFTSPAKFICEVYHPNARTLSPELHIPRTGTPVLLNYGDMRMEPVWNGYVIPPQDLAPPLHARLCAVSQQIALVAQRMGYQGLINIDAIVTPAGELLFTEFNGRAGGATNIDVIARRLIGPEFMDTHVLVTRNGMKSPRVGEVAGLLDDRGLHFDRAKSAGVVITTNNAALGTIEYVAFGRDWAEAESYELRLEELLREVA